MLTLMVGAFHVSFPATQIYPLAFCWQHEAWEGDAYPMVICLLSWQGCGSGVSADALDIYYLGVSERWAQLHRPDALACLLSQSLSSSDHGLGIGGEDARDQLPVNGGSLAPGPETDTDVTGAVPAATAEVTDGGPETGVQNTSM